VADTWVFDGTKWTNACGSAPARACGPPARVFGAFAYAHDNPGGITGAVLAEGGDLFGGPTSRRTATRGCGATARGRGWTRRGRATR
jgi:hypothetical protein